MRHAVFHSIWIGIIRSQQSEINVALSVERDRGSIDPSRTDVCRRPAACHDFLNVSLSVAIPVPELDVALWECSGLSFSLQTLQLELFDSSHQDIGTFVGWDIG